MEDGIAQSQVYCALQDKRGVLWFGTQGGGLTAYDGVHFKTFTEKEGLIDNTINDIKQDKKGNLWIATKKGVCIYNGLKFKKLKSKNKLDIRANKLSFAPNGTCWIAAFDGLYWYDGNSIHAVSQENKWEATIVNTVFCDGDKIYFGTQNGLFLWDTKQRKRTAFSQKSRFMNNAITAVYKDKKGTIWIGTFGDGLYAFNGKNFYRIDWKQELYRTSVLDIYEDEEGYLWMATLQQGVLRYSPYDGLFQQLSEADGLSSRHVRTILQDNAGNFWFGTSGGGVCNYLGRQFTTFNAGNGIRGKLVYAIYQDKKDHFWIGTDKGVSQQKGGKWFNFGLAEGFDDIQCKAITGDEADNVFFGTEGKGLFWWKDSVFTKLENCQTAHIRSLLYTGNKTLWIATAGLGIYQLNYSKEAREWKHYTIDNGLLSNRITALLQDSKGNIWYATEKNGAACISLEGKTSLRFTVNNGLKSNEITALAEDKQGNIWMGTLGSGVECFDRHSGKIKHFSYSEGLTSAIAYLLAFDEFGNLNIGSEKGLDYVRLNSNLQVLKVKHYSKGDGFNGVETCRNAVYKDKEGTLWLGTINGVTRFYPTGHRKNEQPPVVHLTDVKLFYESLSKTSYKGLLGDWGEIKKLDLPYNQNHLTFEFFGVNLSNPDAVKYRWKLEGFDKNWSPATQDNSIVYSNLPPGEYRFLVKACNEDLVWSKPYQMVFSIDKPFWYQWWFVLLSISVLGGLVYLIVQVRIRKVKREAKEMQRQLQMEKEIIELEQKALRLQMNPHFIFNALTSIQSQIGSGNDKEARYYLAKFSRLMRQILDFSRRSSILLQEETALLENYLLVEQFCNGNNFDYSIEVQEELEADFVQIPPMLLQPFVENAIKHGFRQLETKGRRGILVITFREEDGMLVCEIMDNGIGRKAAAELQEKSNAPQHESMALKITQERLDLFRETATKSTLEIIDLQEGKEAKGTKVVIKIPFK